MPATARLDIELLPPRIDVWRDLVIVSIACTLCSFVVGLLSYFLAVRQVLGRRVSVLGLCLLLVATAVFPFCLVGFLGPHFMPYFMASTYGVTLTFKTVEALLGTHPPGAQQSLFVWVCNFVTPTELRFEARHDDAQNGKAVPRPVRVPSRSQAALRGARHIATFALVNAALVHFGAPFDYRPFGRRGGLTTILDVYYWAACLWSMGEWCTTTAALTVQLLGLDTIPVFRSPILHATSPSNFWGARWNLLIHNLMHRTYFKPVARLTGSRQVGALAAFICSAFFHEYMWAICVHPLADGGMRVGEVTLFFMAQFALCTLEHTLRHVLPKRALDVVHALPQPIKTAATAVCICSFGTLFCENLLRARLFDAMRDMYPQVHVLSWSTSKSAAPL